MEPLTGKGFSSDVIWLTDCVQIARIGGADSATINFSLGLRQPKLNGGKRALSGRPIDTA